MGNSVACNENMWVAVGKGPSTTIAYSTDGKIWNAATGLVFAGIGYGIAYNTKYRTWVAVGGDPDNTTPSVQTIAYSNDGMFWYGAIGNNLFSTAYSVATNNDKLWVAVGSGQNNIASYSGDQSLAQNWNALSPLLVDGQSSDTYSVVYNKNKQIWVAVGFNFTAWSSDSSAWTVKKVECDLRGVNCNVDGDSWFAIGQQSNIYTSSDGKSWTYKGLVGIDKLQYGYGIYTDTSITIAFGYGGNNKNSIYYSEDNGSTWKPAQFNPATSMMDTTNSIAYNENMFIAVGSNPSTGNSLAYSTDGKNWKASNC